MKRPWMWGLLLGLLLPTVTLAANPGLNAVIGALENPFKAGASHAVRDVSAEFFQESHIASLDRTQRGRGTVKFRFEAGSGNRVPVAMFYWEYTEPSRQEIVSDGQTMWVYLPENNQVIESDISMVGQANAANPITFLSGLGNLSRDFLIQPASPPQDVEGNHVLQLRPKKVSALISQLLLVVDRDAVSGGETRFPLLSSTVIDPSGNSTLIEFHNIRVNNGFSKQDFRFFQPPGVDVVRPTGAEMGF